MLVKVKLQFTMYDIVKLELMVPCRFDSLKIYIGVFVMIWTKMAFQEPHKTYFLHFQGVKYHFQTLFVMLIKVKLQFTMYDVVKLELIVPCRFDCLKILYRCFCHDLDQNGIPRTQKHIFCILMVFRIIFRLFLSCQLK